MKHNYITFILGILLCLPIIQLQGNNRLFVSPIGNDANDGSLHKPLRYIQTAINRAEEQASTVPFEIILRQGCYELEKTIEIGNSSKTYSLTIKPYENEKVSISGGKRFTARTIKEVSNQEILRRLQPQMRTVTKEIDLKKAGISLEDLHPSGFGRPSIAAWSELFVNEAPMGIARWPNDSTVAIGKIVESGISKNGEQAHFPVFQYAEDRPSTWTVGKGCWIAGYFAHGYADDMIRVDYINPTDKTIHAAEHTNYGFMTDAPWRQWYALNLPEELNRPGEYVLDAENGKIYFYPPITTVTSLHLSVLNTPLLAIERHSDVNIENITFEYGRHIGIYMEDTHRVIIKGCTIRNMGGIGIAIGKGSLNTAKGTLPEAGGKAVSRMIGDLQGKLYQDILFNRHGGTDNGIVDCYIYNVGSGGISLGGGDRATLTPARNYVENCRIHHFNRIEKSYRPAVWIDGVGNRVSKCDIYDAPSMAIHLHGNNHLIELCNITNVCKEVDDQGAIYYGRDPSEQGNIIRYCYFHELSPRHRVTATYHDDGACGAEVYGNIYYKAGSIPALIGGGHDIHYKNNLFIKSPTAIHIDNRMQNWGRNMVAPDGIIAQRLNTVHFTQPPYSTAYPQLTNYWQENPAFPKRNMIEGNLFYKIGNAVNGRTEWGELRNNWITQTDPGFADPNNPLKGFKAGAQIYKSIKDFPELPFYNIGCNLP